VTRTQEVFLPNFCAIRSVFAVVVGGELLAFVLSLAQPHGGSWQTLSLLSLYLQWIFLGSAALLCVLRTPLARLGDIGAGLAAYALILLVTLLVSEAAARYVHRMPDWHDHLRFIGRSLAVASIVAAVILRYLYIQHAWRQRLESEAHARIDALQARIRPHFLFNSLNTITSMIATAPQAAEELVMDLADLFRASLSQGDRMVMLDDELSLVRGYLRMEQVRMGERLRVCENLGTLPQDALIPPLTLQPLLENAVYYGIEPRENGGTIDVTGRIQDGDVVLEVSNPAPTGEQRRRDGAGMAQANVRERLQLAFGRRGGLQVAERDDVYHVTVRFPYRRGGADEDTDR